MADNSETPKILDELTRANGAAVRRESGRSRLANLLRLLVTVLLSVSLLVILAGLAYFQWNLQLRVNRLSTSNSQLQDTLGQSTAQVAELESDLDAASVAAVVDEALIQSLRDEFSTRLQEINSVLAELQSQLPRSLEQQNGQWRLAEAHHLLRIASRYLPLTADIPTTISLLEAADRLLLQADDRRVQPGREALAQELTQLRAIGSFDPAQVYGRINRVREALDRSGGAPGLQEIYLDRLARPGSESEAAVETTDNSLIDSLLGYLNAIFIWREWPAEPGIVVAPDELFSARNEISLALQQSQLALLTRRREIFQDSLQQALDLVQRYQAALGESGPVLLDELDGLVQDDTFPALPEVARATELIGQLLPGTALTQDPAAGQ